MPGTPASRWYSSTAQVPRHRPGTLAQRWHPRHCPGTPGSYWHHWHSAGTPASSWHHLTSPWHCSDTALAPLRSHPHCLALPWHCQAPPGTSGHRPGTFVHCPGTDLAAPGAALSPLWHCPASLQRCPAPAGTKPELPWHHLTAAQLFPSTALASPWHHSCIAPALTNRFRETPQDLFISLHIINTNTIY